MITQYRQRNHRVLRNEESELGRWIDKEFPDCPGLFIYFHLRTGNFILACWRQQWLGKFEEVLTFPGHPCRATREELAEIVRRVRRPRPLKSILDKVDQDEYQEDRRLTDESHEESARRAPRKVQILTPGRGR